MQCMNSPAFSILYGAEAITNYYSFSCGWGLESSFVMVNVVAWPIKAASLTSYYTLSSASPNPISSWTSFDTLFASTLSFSFLAFLMSLVVYYETSSGFLVGRISTSRLSPSTFALVSYSDHCGPHFDVNMQIIGGGGLIAWRLYMGSMAVMCTNLLWTLTSEIIYVI